ncbi:MAG: hypothetical protein J5515_04605 [Lachnospiraceae bacterium]|nr:hypothetical protein [Lachnospiraceae bacterium]
MKKVFAFLKKEIMLTVAVLAAVVSLFITPPTKALIKEIDWHTLGTLFMMLCVLEGFKQENIFEPVINFSKKFKSMTTLSLFLIFGVFFSSMFVTNDVSLIIFVPLTILLFKKGDKEKYILPVISMENIAAIRGSLLMPFGSPQNLFLFGQSKTSVWNFMLHMSPLCVGSAILLIIFVLVLYRKNLKEEFNTELKDDDLAKLEKNADRKESAKQIKIRKIAYLSLFAMIILTIVTRTKFWPVAVGIVIIVIAIVNIKLFTQVDYVLIFTFLCFFVFSSSIASNPGISGVLQKAVAENEYWWALGLSQIISNVPASIVLYPFTKNFAGLIYGLDTAGLCSLIGSLASVINYRIYVREYPSNGFKFIKTFTLVSWAFFIIVVIPGFFLSKWNFF